MDKYTDTRAESAGQRRGRAVRTYTADLSAVGEPALWGLGGALALGIILIAGFLVMITWNGITTFWPKPIVVVTLTLTKGGMVAGEPSRDEAFRVGPELLRTLSPEARAAVEEADGYAHRVLYRIGNYDLYNEDFRWVSDFDVASAERPKDILFLERQEWGPFIGRIAGLVVDEATVDRASLTYGQVRALQRDARQRFERIRTIERSDIGAVNHAIEKERLRLRRTELEYGRNSDQYRDLEQEVQPRIDDLQQRYAALADEARDIRAFDQRTRIVLEEIGGRTKELPLSTIVQLYPANDLLDRV